MEYQDLYRVSDGRYVGKHIRGRAIPNGTYLHLVSVFTVNSKREILLTQRAESKSHALEGPFPWAARSGLVEDKFGVGWALYYNE